MYLNLGHAFLIPEDDIVGIFDMDNTSWSFRTRMFLEQAEEEGRVIDTGDDLPRSFVLCHVGEGETAVYTSTLNTATLIKRAENSKFSLDKEEK